MVCLMRYFFRLDLHLLTHKTERKKHNNAEPSTKLKPLNCFTSSRRERERHSYDDDFFLSSFLCCLSFSHRRGILSGPRECVLLALLLMMVGLFLSCLPPRPLYNEVERKICNFFHSLLLRFNLVSTQHISRICGWSFPLRWLFFSFQTIIFTFLLQTFSAFFFEKREERSALNKKKKNKWAILSSESYSLI